jgi:hypothetical protein
MSYISEFKGIMFGFWHVITSLIRSLGPVCGTHLFPSPTTVDGGDELFTGRPSIRRSLQWTTEAEDPKRVSREARLVSFQVGFRTRITILPSEPGSCTLLPSSSVKDMVDGMDLDMVDDNAQAGPSYSQQPKASTSAMTVPPVFHPPPRKAARDLPTDMALKRSSLHSFPGQHPTV